MDFKGWLQNNEAVQNEYQEALVASFLHKKIAKSVKSFFENDRRESLPHYLAQLLPGEVNDDRGVFLFPEQVGEIRLAPEFKGWKMEFGPASEDTFAYCGSGRLGLPYDKDVLRKAQGLDDPAVDRMLSRMEDQLVHECSHICTSKPGDDAKVKDKPYWVKFKKGSPQYAEAQIRYYTDPGEVRAHARQYANIYMKQVNQEYDQRKLEQMAWDLNDNKLFRFVNRLRDKDVQKDFPHLKDRMTQAHSDFLKWIEYFVGQGRIVFN